MRKLLFLLLLAAGQTLAQSADRLTLLQNSRNVVVSTHDGRHYFYIVNSERYYAMFLRGENIVIDGDTIAKADISSIRYKPMTRFAIDEDSTALGNNYSVDNGLLAFRRTLHTGKWNSLIVPFALTAGQVCDAFGQDTQVARIRGIVEGDVANVEFETLSLANARDTVIQPDAYYLIRPTRNPDVESGKTTTGVYGGARIDGPVYVIPNVSITKGTRLLVAQVVRSEERNVALRFRGTYGAKDVATSRYPIYLLNDSGRYSELTESAPVKAFTHWIEEAVNKTGLALRFYVNGIQEDITMPSSIDDPMRDGRQTADVYDLAGRRLLAAPRHGIYIVNGRKVIK